MAYLLVWSPRALDDVDAIAAYIAEDSEHMLPQLFDLSSTTREGCLSFHITDVLFPSLAMKEFVRFLHIVIGSSIR